MVYSGHPHVSLHEPARPYISQISLIEIETLISKVSEVMQPADGRAKIPTPVEPTLAVTTLN